MTRSEIRAARRKPDASRLTGARAEADVLETLRRTLSDKEIDQVLARGLDVLDDAGRKRLLARLGKDTGAVLRAVLEPDPKMRAAHPARPGKGKVRQQWEALRAEWDDCIFESGLEDGKYVQQDADWEPPYLDTGSVCDDLDQIARRMRDLLGRVWDEGLDPDFSFARVLAEAAAEIGVRPDGIDVVEPPHFGRESMTCLLEWEWRCARRDGLGAFEFLRTIREIERALGDATIEEDAVATFVAALGADDQREIMRGLVEHHRDEHWADVLSETRSGWFRMYQGLARKWDPALFAKTCRDNIAQDFTLALPLIAERLRHRAYAEALPLIEEAVRAMLRIDARQTWDPRSGLLVRHPALAHRGDPDEAQFRLLEAWQKVAGALGDEDVACALALQVVVGRKRDDWDAVLSAFRAASKPCEVLFADWRADAAERSVGVFTTKPQPARSDWVHALIDAARADNAGVFCARTRTWLLEVERSGGKALGRRSALATLLLDVDGAGHLQKKCPTLYRLAARERSGVRTVDAVRRRWIARLGGFDLFREVVAFWTRHARTLIPDPSDAHGSSYDQSAEWMAAMLELDAETYKTVLQAWSVEHKRRRNLWRALAARHLPGLPASR